MSRLGGSRRKHFLNLEDGKSSTALSVNTCLAFTDKDTQLSIVVERDLLL